MNLNLLDPEFEFKGLIDSLDRLQEMIGLATISWMVRLEALLDEEEDEVLDAVGVAPLVVVPADDLGCVADDLGQLGVEDGGERVAAEVGTDELFVCVAKVALQGTGGCMRP